MAAHFVPSNLAAVHRSRLWTLHLREFGWEPLIVTTHWNYYEETPDFKMMKLVPSDLRIVRTKAFPTRPVRIVGDVGFRALFWHYRALVDLARAGEIDFVHITIPSNFSAVLGRLVKRKTGTPYGIDYIDPWVHPFPGSDQPFTKAWTSARLAEWLEPWAVREASVISGINRHYYEGMLERNPRVAEEAVLVEMPYGGSELDHEHVRNQPGTAELLTPHAGKFNLIYAGTMWAKAYAVLDRFLEGVAFLRQTRPQLAQQFHLHFVGTGRSPDDPEGFTVRPYIKRHHLEDCVSEHPKRLSYVDVLTTLHAASGILIFGSTEPHYSPSKVFQSIMSRRPVFALLHERSTAVPLLRSAQAGTTLTLREDALPTANTISSALEHFIYDNRYSDENVRWDVLGEYSARQSAKVLAAALDEATAQGSARTVRPEPEKA